MANEPKKREPDIPPKQPDIQLPKQPDIQPEPRPEEIPQDKDVPQRKIRQCSFDNEMRLTVWNVLRVA